MRIFVTFFALMFMCQQKTEKLKKNKQNLMHLYWYLFFILFLIIANDNETCGFKTSSCEHNEDKLLSIRLFVCLFSMEDRTILNMKNEKIQFLNNFDICLYLSFIIFHSQFITRWFHIFRIFSVNYNFELKSICKCIRHSLFVSSK